MMLKGAMRTDFSAAVPLLFQPEQPPVKVLDGRQPLSWWASRSCRSIATLPSTLMFHEAGLGKVVLELTAQKGRHLTM
jgi:hypothetical protein